MSATVKDIKVNPLKAEVILTSIRGLMKVQRNTFFVPFVIHTRGVTISPWAQALNNRLGKLLCLLMTCDKNAWNFASFTSPRCSCVDVTAQ